MALNSVAMKAPSVPAANAASDDVNAAILEIIRVGVTGRCDVEQTIRIIALDRQGHYACELVDKVPQDAWGRFVRMGEQFGIDEAALAALCDGGQVPVAARAIAHRQPNGAKDLLTATKSEKGPDEFAWKSRRILNLFRRKNEK